MPELPDIVAYVEAISARVIDTELLSIRIYSPFLLRSVSPPVSDLVGKKIVGVSRLGKRIVIELEGDLFLVIHLMIAGRLGWKEEAPTKRPMGRIGLATIEFSSGTLMLTEAGSKKRAALHLFLGKQALAELDPGGIDVLETDEKTFAETIRQE